MTTVQADTKTAVALALADNDIISFGTFTLKSGIESPVYIDLRKIQSHPAAFHTIVSAYSELLDELDKNALLAGVPEAATPLAAALGYELKRPIIQPRKVVKDHGTKSSVEGEFSEGDKVIVIDDLITKGDSKVEAIDQIEQAGLSIEALVVLIDREQGGVELLRQKGRAVIAALTMSELMKLLLENDKVSQAQFDEVMDFIKAS